VHTIGIHDTAGVIGHLSSMVCHVLFFKGGLLWSFCHDRHGPTGLFIDTMRVPWVGHMENFFCMDVKFSVKKTESI